MERRYLCSICDKNVWAWFHHSFWWLPHTPNHHGRGSHVSFRDSGHNFYSSSRRPSHFIQQNTVHVKERKCKTVHKPSLISSHCQRCYLPPCCSRRWPPHHQSGHWICYRVVHCSECRRYWRPYSPAPYDSRQHKRYILCAPHPPQREDESDQSRLFSATLEGSYVRGCYSFMRLEVVTQQLVLMEWVKAPHCQKLWTTLSLVNVQIHSLTWIPPRKMLLGQEILLWNSWPVAMALIPWQFSATKNWKLKFWKGMCWLRQRLSLQLVGQQSNTPSGLTIR